ncbi:HAMP domain-containing sensor histidine kinase [Kocuria sp.]|uniref:sensor histidine kinase n=1 Tax=Kocuria sp. TaxID=1871328 RepID=UPI0026DAE6FD|nr:HAMP domain-containing sensor histidine kinase [Kocuria sp.]MDO4919295.1 HAMP domain-containing sensor histidine kinase [Kocuria sp.]
MNVLTRRFRSASLRSQLMALTGLLLAVSVMVTTLVAVSVLRDSLVTSKDQELAQAVHTMAPVLTGALRGDVSTPVPTSGFLLDRDGHVVATARGGASDDANSPDPDLSRMTLDYVEAHEGQAETVGSEGNSDRTWRVLPSKLTMFDMSLVVAEPLDRTNAIISGVGLLTFSFGLATLLAAMTVGWVLVTRAFQPLRQVEATAARIADGDLSQRMEGYNPQTEIGQLSTSLNAMLGHIEDAFDARTRSETKLRRFVADASHELRTPLVSIRGYSELYRHGALQTPEDVGKAMDRIESESKRMTQLVEDLLTLARLDERRVTTTGPVDLLHLAYDAASDAHATAPDRSVAVVGLDSPSPEAAWVHGDESKLRQVVANLITNALRYTPAGSPLELAVGLEPAVDGQFTSVLQVRDHGPGIHGDDAERVFERFYRADSSRTRETGGTGLGLSIVAAIIDQHDGAVKLEETDGGGATFTVRIPHAEPVDTERQPS